MLQNLEKPKMKKWVKIFLLKRTNLWSASCFGENIEIWLEEPWKKKLKQPISENVVNHRKGAPDGVNATCKRTADQLIPSGGNIINFCQK